MKKFGWGSGPRPNFKPIRFIRFRFLVFGYLLFLHATSCNQHTAATNTPLHNFFLLFSSPAVRDFRHERSATATRKTAATQIPIRPRLVMVAGRKTATGFRHIGAMADIKQHCSLDNLWCSIMSWSLFCLYRSFLVRIKTPCHNRACNLRCIFVILTHLPMLKRWKWLFLIHFLKTILRMDPTIRKVHKISLCKGEGSSWA